MNITGKIIYTSKVQELAIVDGVASLTFRETTCELKGTKNW